MNAAYWTARNAASTIRSAVSVRLRQQIATLRDREFTVHDTHTPFIRREARAIRGTGDGPTPRAQANWANYIFTTINERASDGTGT